MGSGGGTAWGGLCSTHAERRRRAANISARDSQGHRSGSLAADPRPRGSLTLLGFAHSGMFPCFLGGLTWRLFASMFKALIRRGRV